MQTVQVRLTGELVKRADYLVNTGIYSNKSEVIRDALRRLTFKEELITENNRKFTILFTSDLHGNKTQFKKFLEKADLEKANAIILGGDITPKDPKNRSIKGQKRFIENDLIPLIRKFNKKNPSCSIFIILGNDDFKSNYKVLKKYEKEENFTLLHNKCVRLHEDFKIEGYPYVPLTPFSNKDWEKLDLADETEIKTRKKIVKNGKKARGNKFINVEFNLKKRNDTIEKDLKKLMKHVNPRKTILVTHAPPYNTKLDMINKNQHVGSVAIRKIIDQNQPYITLHGHIHESINYSHDFKQNINNTISMCSGNDHISSSLAVVKFDLYNPQEAERIVIP